LLLLGAGVGLGVGVGDAALTTAGAGAGGGVTASCGVGFGAGVGLGAADCFVAGRLVVLAGVMIFAFGLGTGGAVIGWRCGGGPAGVDGAGS